MEHIDAAAIGIVKCGGFGGFVGGAVGGALLLLLDPWIVVETADWFSDRLVGLGVLGQLNPWVRWHVDEAAGAAIVGVVAIVVRGQ